VPQPPQPRRRQSDRDRRRWNDHSLDQLDERIDEHDAAFEDIRRRLSEQRQELIQMRVEMREEAQRNAEFRREVRDSFARNHREHQTVQTTANKIAANVEPTRMSKIKDFAGYVSALIVPFVLAYLTYVLARGGKP
jgi:multidrug resistance efflux pump